MDKNSEPYKDGNYSDLFEAAESSQIVGEDAVLYSRSLANMRAMQAGLEYRYEEGRAEERAKTRETMRRLLEMGIQPDMLARAAGMSIDDIERLR